MALSTAAVAILMFYIAAHGRVDFVVFGRHHAIRRVVPVSLSVWLLLVGTFAVIPAPRRQQIIERFWRLLGRRSAAMAAALAITVSIAALHWGAMTAAGADPYGYVSQSLLWANGNPVQLAPVFALDAPTDIAAFAPLGYRSGATAGTIVPYYSIGLPLLMAAAVKVTGPRGSFLPVPILAGLTVWITFAIARRLMPPPFALVAAAAAATSPVFLFQAMQPMSDVPVTALWLAATALAMRDTATGALAAGAAASLAMLVRPNIVLVAIPVLGFASRAPQGRWWPPAVSRALLFAGGCIPGVVLTATVDDLFYGSPISSGYGTLGVIFHAGEGPETAAKYLRWMWDTQSVLPFIAFAGPALSIIRRDAVASAVRDFSWFAIAFTGVLLGSYAFYVRFDHWSYLRFLLPAIPLLLIAALGALAVAAASWKLSWQLALAALLMLVAPLAYLHSAVKGEALALKGYFRQEFESGAALARSALPRNSIFLTVRYSGSLNFYAQRQTVRFDFVEPEQLPTLLSYFRARGFVPYAAVDSADAALMRGRFKGTAVEAALQHRESWITTADGKVAFIPLY